MSTTLARRQQRQTAGVSDLGRSKHQKNIRLSDVARALLEELADRKGVSQADVVEMLIRDEAVRQELQSAKRYGLVHARNGR